MPEKLKAGLHVYIAPGLSKNGHFTSYSGQLAVYYDYSCMVKNSKGPSVHLMSKVDIQLPKMNVSCFAISLSKTAIFKRAWQTLKVLPRH